MKFRPPDKKSIDFRPPNKKGRYGSRVRFGARAHRPPDNKGSYTAVASYTPAQGWSSKSYAHPPTRYPPERHVHDWSDIDGKPDEYPPERHVHDWSGIDIPPILEVLLHVLPRGDVGEVLTKTEYGFKWKKVEQTTVEQYVNIRTEAQAVTNAIIDSEGVFLVDSEGEYVEAV